MFEGVSDTYKNIETNYRMFQYITVHFDELEQSNLLNWVGHVEFESFASTVRIDWPIFAWSTSENISLTLKKFQISIRRTQIQPSWLDLCATYWNLKFLHDITKLKLWFAIITIIITTIHILLQSLSTYFSSHLYIKTHIMTENITKNHP